MSDDINGGKNVVILFLLLLYLLFLILKNILNKMIKNDTLKGIYKYTFFQSLFTYIKR